MAGREADRGDGDPPCADAESPGRVQRSDGLDHVPVVREWFTHFHEDDVGHSTDAVHSSQTPGLFHDASRGEIAFEASQSRGAESTSHRTSHLGGDACRAAGPRRNHDAFRLSPTRGWGERAIFGDDREPSGSRLGQVVMPGQQEFSGAVAGLLRDDLVGLDEVQTFGESQPVAFGDVGHLLEFGHASLVHPPTQLLRQERFELVFTCELRELGLIEIEESDGHSCSLRPTVRSTVLCWIF